MHRGTLAQPMPFKKRIAEVEQSIEEARAALEMLRRGVGKSRDKSKQRKLLAELARLKSERTRLMMHQLARDQESN